MSTPMKLLNEQCISETKILTEGAPGQTEHMYITGPFLQAVTKNRNRKGVPTSHY